MKVRYIYSACIEIEAGDEIILCDPWFTEGIYDGAWYHFPKIANPLEVLRKPTAIYISHIHPDHYDPVFLRQLIDKFGDIPIYIPNHKLNYLERKAKSDGIKVTVVDSLKLGDVDMHIIPRVTSSAVDIDSALVVHHDGNVVVNLNDCLYSDVQIDTVKACVAKYSDRIDLLALGYTGAGPYPQTYFDIDTQHAKLTEEADKKKHNFFGRYRRTCEIFGAKYHLPFAGKYILGGKLAKLNPYRGVADAVEVCEFDDRAVILADAGEGVIDLKTGHITATRDQVYNEETLQQRYNEIINNSLSYETQLKLNFNEIPFDRLLRRAISNAHPKSEVTSDYHFLIHIQENEQTKRTVLINTHKDKQEFDLDFDTSNTDNLPEPRSEIFIDYRNLFGLLSGIYHWNNNEVGSINQVRRYPNNAYNWQAQAYLNFFSAA